MRSNNVVRIIVINIEKSNSLTYKRDNNYSV